MRASAYVIGTATALFVTYSAARWATAPAERPSPDDASGKPRVLRHETLNVFPRGGGEVLSRSFDVRNDTSADMALTEIGKSCGCISHAADGLRIPAGQSRDVVLSAHIGPGVEKTLTAVFRTENAEVPELALEWKIVAHERLTVMPQEWGDLEIPAGGMKRMPVKITVRRPLAEPAAPVHVKSASQFIEIREKSRAANEREGISVVTIKCEAVVKWPAEAHGDDLSVANAPTLSGSIVVTSGEHHVERHYRWHREDGVTCRPRRLFFQGRAGDRVAGVIRLQSQDDVKVLGVSSSLSGLSPEVEYDEDRSDQVTVSLTLPNTSDGRAVVTSIALKLHHDRQDILEVPVYALVRDRESEPHDR